MSIAIAYNRRLLIRRLARARGNLRRTAWKIVGVALILVAIIEIALLP